MDWGCGQVCFAGRSCLRLEESEQGIFLTPVFYVLLRRVTGNRPLVLHGDALPFAASHGEQPRELDDVALSGKRA